MDGVVHLELDGLSLSLSCVVLCKDYDWIHVTGLGI